MDSDHSYTDTQSIHTQWRVKTIKVFKEALQRYKAELTPYDNNKNELIKDEIEVINVMLNSFEKRLAENNDDFFFISMAFQVDYLRRIYDLLWKYKELKDMNFTRRS